MTKKIIGLLNLEELRKGLLQYTREAFSLLPRIDKPSVLDIGCGSGIPTLELASLSKGLVVGIDIDLEALIQFTLRIKQNRLSHRVKIIRCSFCQHCFTDKAFDLLWDEGALHLLGLERSLLECRRILKPRGFFVLNETYAWLKGNLKKFKIQGFELADRLLLPEGIWWSEYYQPLERRIKNLILQYPDAKKINSIKQYENEIKMVKKNPAAFDCAFYILRKTR